MHDSWRCFKEGRLPWYRRGGLLRRELQQLEQSGVLRPQPGQLSLNRHRIISHKGHATGATDRASSGRVLDAPFRSRFPSVSKMQRLSRTG